MKLKLERICEWLGAATMPGHARPSAIASVCESIREGEETSTKFGAIIWCCVSQVAKKS